jgi:hypothetical protein
VSTHPHYPSAAWQLLSIFPYQNYQGHGERHYSSNQPGTASTLPIKSSESAESKRRQSADVKI